MGKIGGFILDIILALTIIFLAVTIYFGLRTENVMRTLGSEISDHFIKSAKKNGYFTPEDYDEFIRNISLSGALYDIELEHKYTIYEPEYRLRTLQEVLEEQNKSYTGKNEYTYIPVTTTKPVVNDPVNNGNLNTETNESVLASAVNTPPLASHVHSDDCYLGHRHKEDCIQESYYTGPAIDMFLYDLDEELLYGMLDRDHYFKCPTCGRTVFEVHHSDGEITFPLASTAGVYALQCYLDGDNSIKWKETYKIYRYLTSHTRPEEPGWILVRDTVYIDGRPIYIEQWRKPIAFAIYEDHLYFNAFLWLDDNYYARPSENMRFWGYKDKYSCPYCLQDGTLPKTLVHESSCNQTQDDTIDCNAIITSITPTHPVQTVATNDPLISTVRATYLDGSTRVVLASTDFSTANVVENETATLTYTYVIDGVTFSKSCSINVTVIPRSKTCVNGHTYNLKNDGSDPGCPYCKAWVSSISFIYPTTTPFEITIGTTLQDNGVILLITYLDGHRETISSGYVDNLDKKYLGAQTVTIGYKGLTTTLRVITVRAKTTCTICGYVYELYPDGTDPGCPKCLEKIPVFTGNIMVHENAEYTEHILEHLYQEGIYEFNHGDKLVLKIKNRTSSLGRNVLSMLFPSLSERWFSYINEEIIQLN